MDTVLEVLASTSFLEKRSRFEQQKTFEAELARQAEIGKARAQFLRDLVDPVWQFQLLALQVSYDSHSAERFPAALAQYDEQSWQHLKRIRAIVGGARWFTSEPAYQALTEFVDGWLIHEVDMELMKRRGGGGKASWTEFNQWLYAESRRRTDALLVILAKDFGLAPQ